jgi:multidrug efflux pump subunit AcrA (membrane-fusion protein)
LAAFLLLLVAACGDQKGDNPTKTSPPPTPEAKAVKVTSVKAAPLRGSVQYVGTLTAHLKVDVSSELGGTIERLYFDRGDRVKTGQLLAEIGTRTIQMEVQQAEAAMMAAQSQRKKTEKGSRPEEIRIAEAALDEAMATLREAEKNYRRIEKLQGDAAVSKRDYDSAKKMVEAARAAVASTEQQLELARKGPRIEDREAARANLAQARASLNMARDRLRKSTLLSPCDGVIAFREVEAGEVIAPGTTITRVVDNSKMKIRLSMSERDLPLVRKDKPYAFTVDALPGKPFSCRLAFVSPAADTVTRSFPMELQVDEVTAAMADGMTARVTFPLHHDEKTIKVHASWITEHHGKMGLYVVEGGRAYFREVAMGMYYDQFIEILSGIGDQALVVMNPAGLKNGDVVTYDPPS